MTVPDDLNAFKAAARILTWLGATKRLTLPIDLDLVRQMLPDTPLGRGAVIKAHAYYKPVQAIYGQAPVAEGGPLPCFGGAGTGGIEGVHFATSRQGYRPFTVIVKVDVETIPEPYAPYADLMKEVKSGFGRTLSHLSSVFGVSRQTLYNWLNGEIPKEQLDILPSLKEGESYGATR